MTDKTTIPADAAVVFIADGDVYAFKPSAHAEGGEWTERLADNSLADVEVLKHLMGGKSVAFLVAAFKPAFK